ncbi:MAG: prepilin-type N-terminal cleavage/methylation domain-containing protein [Opitutaceae bacterium]|nr:prepilin-type N-terminal cleavage/methylation domain-containing protein [Opitutaceae bacterium]
MHSRFHLALRHRHSGFTLVEIMVVVVIIGILAALAILTIARVRRSAQNTCFINDLRTFAQAFETYAMKNGSWPSTAASGVVPPEMVGELRDAKWTGVNSLGGRWRWIKRTWGASGGRAAIQTTGVTVVDAQMAEIDAKIDDGNLGSGSFVKAGSGRYTYILQR